MIFPFGSINTLNGIPSNLYVGTAALFHCLRSLMWFQLRPSFFTASSQAALSLSSDTPSMVKFLSLYLLYAATTLGFSFLHGTHQLAQKSTRSEERRVG